MEGEPPDKRDRTATEKQREDDDGGAKDEQSDAPTRVPASAREQPYVAVADRSDEGELGDGADDSVDNGEDEEDGDGDGQQLNDSSDGRECRQVEPSWHLRDYAAASAGGGHLEVAPGARRAAPTPDERRENGKPEPPPDHRRPEQNSGALTGILQRRDRGS